MRYVIGLSAIVALSACASMGMQPKADTASPPARADITMGNGANNSIDPSGVMRVGATLTFAAATVAQDSWLVVHPFKDGRPNGDIYVGHTFLAKGSHQDIPVTIEGGAETGQMFLVMLHEDVDRDQNFDFVFVDEVSVEDRAVFEGTTMIAHIFAAP